MDHARDLKWNICHITNPAEYVNHGKTQKKIVEIMDPLPNFCPKYVTTYFGQPWTLRRPFKASKNPLSI